MAGGAWLLVLMAASSWPAEQDFSSPVQEKGRGGSESLSVCFLCLAGLERDDLCFANMAEFCWL